MSILAIAQNDLACYAKKRGPIFWTFLGPAACMWLFGFFTPSASTLSSLAVSNHDKGGDRSSALILGLRRNGHSVVEADNLPRGVLSVEIPAGFSATGAQLPITIHAGASETGAERSLRYEIEAELASDSAPLTSRSNKPQPPEEGGFQRTVPAYLIMFLTMNLMVSGAGFAEERNSGRLRRLLTAPVSSFAIVAGRLGSRLVIAWLQMLVLFSIGVFVLRIHWAEHAAAMIFVLTLYTLAMGGVGILFGTLFRDPDQAQTTAMWTALLMAPLTGLWWPIELMPKPFVTLAHWLPTGSVMQCVSSMLALGSGLEQFPLTILELAVVAGAAIWMASRQLSMHR